MTFRPLTEPVDTIRLQNRESPGVAEITGASAPNMWDERRGFALSGAKTRFRGRGLAKFTVRLSLFLDSHFDDWEAWRPLVLRPPTGERPRAMDIWHPILEELEVSSVVVVSLGQLTQKSPGLWQVEIQFSEQRPPLPASTEIEGSEEAPRPLSRLELDIQTRGAELLGETLRESLESERFARRLRR